MVGLAKELEQMAFGAHAPIYRENPMSGPPLGKNTTISIVRKDALNLKPSMF